MISDWETPPGPGRRRLLAAMLSVLVVALTAGVVWTQVVGSDGSCDEVLDRAAQLSVRLHDGSGDQMETVRELARIADRRDGCFTETRRRALAELAEHGPPEIGILSRPRTERDDAHGLGSPTQLVLDEARFARTTEDGSFYVIPQELPGLPRDVCLYLAIPDGGSSLSCSPPIVASVTGLHPYPVVLTLSSGLDGLAGIVGDGVSHVLVDGVRTPVHDNVFVARSASAVADVQIPPGNFVTPRRGVAG